MAKESKGTTPEAVTVEDVKAAAVNEEKPVSAPKAVQEEAAKPKKAAKEETLKAEPKKAAAPAKKSPGRPRKTAKEKAAKEKAVLVPEMFVQYDDTLAGAQEASVADIVAKVKALYVAQGHRESSIKSLQIYMKPQMWKAYYVINHKIEGDIDLF